MVRKYKRGRYWYADYPFRGRRVRGSLGVTTRVAAEAARAAIELALAQGRTPAAALAYTLQEIAPQYLAFCEGRNQPLMVKDKRRYLARFARHVGDAPLAEITRADVEDYQTRRKKRGASNVLLNRELAAIKHMFSFALARGLVSSNPCRGVRMLPERKRTPRILSEEERERFLAWCADNDPLLYDLSVIAAYTGLRRGDILKIKGEEVSLERGEGYLFPGRGTPHLTDFKNRFRRAVEATGIRFLFRELRANCATALLEAGADIFDVQNILGHSNITTTTRYLALVDERKRKAIERLGGGEGP